MHGYIINGIFPRDEDLIRATREFDRGRCTAEHVYLLQEKERKLLFSLQKDAAFISDGLLNWQDLLRPFSEILTGAWVDGLVRFFETNTFYRRFYFEGNVKILEGELTHWRRQYFFDEGNEGKIMRVLPSPSLFVRFSEGISIEKAAGVLAEITKFLSDETCGAIVFEEPFLTDEPLEHEKALKKFYEDIRDIQCKIILHTYFGNIAERLNFYLSLPIDALGIDFYRTPIEALDGIRFPEHMALLAGVVNTENTLIEKPDDIHRFVERVGNMILPAGIIISGNADFQFLPYEVALKKVEVLKSVESVK